MMQHRGMDGAAIGNLRGETLDERMRRIRLERLAAVARLTHEETPWFAVRVWTGRETAVDNALSGIGVHALVPMRKGPDLRRRHRIIPGQMMPVIHGYVLVQVDPGAESLDALKGVEHVIEVLGGCLSPRRLAKEEVNHFKDMAADGAYDWERPSDLVVATGDLVRIIGGPFSEFNAVVVTANGKGKGDVVVSVNILGGDVPVTLPLAMLEKL